MLADSASVRRISTATLSPTAPPPLATSLHHPFFSSPSPLFFFPFFLSSPLCASSSLYPSISSRSHVSPNHTYHIQPLPSLAIRCAFPQQHPPKCSLQTVSTHANTHRHSAHTSIYIYTQTQKTQKH